MNSKKIRLKEAVIVEGKYDKIKLQSIVSTPIIETNGFRIFKDKEKQMLIRQIAKARGILIMTDSDSAGFVIRNFIKGFLSEIDIKHCYAPTILGKEKRKAEMSKEGILGVEGIDISALTDAIKKSGATIIDEDKSAEINNQNSSQEIVSNPANSNENEITKLDFYTLGLTGREYSKKYREEVLTSLSLPTYLSTNAMISAINCLFSKAEFFEYMKELEVSLEEEIESK